MYYLINTGKRLITDSNFVAWTHYPIIKEVYYKYSKYALCDITTWEDFKEMLPSNWSGLIYGYINKLLNILPSKLVEESSKKNSPYYIVCNIQNKMYGEIPTYLMEYFANRMRMKINNDIDYQAINEYTQILYNKGINIIDLCDSEYLHNIYIDDNDYEKYNNIINDISSDIHRKYKDITKNIACLPIKWKMSWI